MLTEQLQLLVLSAALVGEGSSFGCSLQLLSAGFLFFCSSVFHVIPSRFAGGQMYQGESGFKLPRKVNMHLSRVLLSAGSLEGDALYSRQQRMEPYLPRKLLWKKLHHEILVAASRDEAKVGHFQRDSSPPNQRQANCSAALVEIPAGCW